MRQFEVWWANLPEPAGRRPVLLLSRDGAYGYLNKFIVAEITTTIRSIPMEVQLGTRDGLPSRCAANLDNVQTLRRDRFGERITWLPPARQLEVKRALGFALGWAELIDLEK